MEIIIQKSHIDETFFDCDILYTYMFQNLLDRFAVRFPFKVNENDGTLDIKFLHLFGVFSRQLNL
jgi:hypothetical protein